MQTYSRVTAEFIEELKQITGPSYVKTDADLLIAYQTDYESDPKLFHMPEAAVAPASSEEISQILKLANRYKVPVTVRSGGTSLADGAIPVCGGLVLLMERLNKILELNEEGMYMTVEAGVVPLIYKIVPNQPVFCMPAIRPARKAVLSAAIWQRMPAV